MQAQPMKSTRDVKNEERLAWLLKQIEELTPPKPEIPLHVRIAPRIRRNGKWVE